MDGENGTSEIPDNCHLSLVTKVSIRSDKSYEQEDILSPLLLEIPPKDTCGSLKFHKRSDG